MDPYSSERIVRALIRACIEECIEKKIQQGLEVYFNSHVLTTKLGYHQVKKD